MADSLCSKMLKLKQETNSISSNPILLHIPQETLNVIETEASKDTYLQNRLTKMIRIFPKLKVGWSDDYKNFFDIFNEAQTYLFLKSRIPIIPIPEQKFKTPDFKGSLNKDVFHIEFKTIGYANGNVNYNQMMNDALDAQIDLEKQKNSGKRTASAIYSVAPLRKGSRSLYERRDNIDTIIDKISQNLKPDQFNEKSTILLVDLALIPICPNRRECSPYYFADGMPSILSGYFWSVSFGRLGDRVYDQVEFEGKPNVSGELKRNGILNDFNWIPGICFQVYNLQGDREIYGFWRNGDDKIKEYLLSFCHFTNDDLNTECFNVLP